MRSTSRTARRLVGAVVAAALAFGAAAVVNAGQAGPKHTTAAEPTRGALPAPVKFQEPDWG